MHSEIDLRLIDKIEDLLHPIIGDWEDSDTWYHKMDYYGDGIRSLMFNWSVFDADFVPKLQALLVGEHDPFCILCQIFEDIGADEPDRFGTIAIFSNRLVISRAIANRLALVDK